MMNYFHGGLDYIFFLRGFSLLLLAAAGFFLRKEKPAKLAWRWFAFFALAHAASEFLDLAAFSFSGSPALAVIRLLVLALSFGLLLEFARRSKYDTSGSAPGPGIYVPFVLLSSLGGFYGLSGLNASVRYFGGLGSGLFACYVVCRAARGLPVQLRRPLTALGALLGLYALSANVVVSGSAMPPAGRLNYEAFYAAFGFPAQLPGAILLALMAGFIWFIASSMWIYSRSLRTAEPGAGAAFFGRNIRWLPLAALAAVLAAGWLGTSGLGRAERTALVRESRNNASILYFRMNEKLLGIGQTASVMAEADAMRQAAITRGAGDIEKANLLLDRFQKVQEVDVCYLLDSKGTVIASSNRRDPLSFVGENYAFRPYFTEAIRGKAARYFALGNTTKTRGYYVGSPVTDRSGRVLAVVTIKKNLDFLEEEMRLMPCVFFVSPEGVVFLSGRRDFLFSSLWTVAAGSRYELLKSNQFGPLDFAPVWKEAPADGALVSLEGEELYASRLMFGSDGWSLISLSPTRSVLATRFYGISITFVLCLLTLGLVVIFAQYEARHEEVMELMRVRGENQVLSGLLPVCASCRRIRDDKEYRARVETYVSSHLKVFSAGGLCPDCAKKAAEAGGMDLKPAGRP